MPLLLLVFVVAADLKSKQERLLYHLVCKHYVIKNDRKNRNIR